MLKLYIANKNYSSWSLRPWLLMSQAGIAFEEVMVPFDDMAASSPFKQTLQPLAPTGQVPLLVDGDLVVWDTLAIAEYLAEKLPEKKLWPADARARARARSVCAEMHAGFSALRNHCPMNLEASLPEMGRVVWRDQAGVRANVARIVAMWQELLDTHGGPMLFGDFGIADAYYAPVCVRLAQFALPVPPAIAAYIERVRALPAMQRWTAAALAEHRFVDFDEPYRAAP
jgi:glutathione S-transferase